MEINGCQHKKE